MTVVKFLSGMGSVKWDIGKALEASQEFFYYCKYLLITILKKNVYIYNNFIYYNSVLKLNTRNIIGFYIGFCHNFIL